MKPLVMIVIFCSIFFTKVFAQKEIYIFGYRRPIYSSELESVYIVEREIMGDTIVITEFIQHSNTKFEQKIVKKGNSLFYDQSTEFKLDAKEGSWYKTSGVIKGVLVNVHVVRVGVDTTICGMDYMFNVYEVFYADDHSYTGNNIRFFIDTNKLLFIKVQAFYENTIFVENFLLKEYSYNSETY